MERRLHAEHPLVINTCGWIKGVGADILNFIYYNIDCSHVVFVVARRVSEVASRAREAGPAADRQRGPVARGSSRRTRKRGAEGQSGAVTRSEDDQLLLWPQRGGSRRLPAVAATISAAVRVDSVLCGTCAQLLLPSGAQRTDRGTVDGQFVRVRTGA